MLLLHCLTETDTEIETITDTNKLTQSLMGI